MTAEEIYNIECQIDALYDEAEYCDDHNDPARAVQCRYEAEELRKKLEASTAHVREEVEDTDPFEVDWNTSDRFAKPFEVKADRFAKPFEVKSDRFSKPIEIKSDKPVEPTVAEPKKAAVDSKLAEDAKALEDIAEVSEEQVKLSDEVVGKILDFFKGSQKKFWENYPEVLASGTRPDGSFYVELDNSNPMLIGDTADSLKKLCNELGSNICFETETNDHGFYGRTYVFCICEGSVEEDYTGLPEERTDHLEYVDDNPTDGKFKLPKNITKKEDDHCNVNPVVNCDPDDKKVLTEATELKESWRDYDDIKADMHGCHIEYSCGELTDEYVSFKVAKLDADGNTATYEYIDEDGDECEENREVFIDITGPTPDEFEDWYEFEIDGDWDYDDYDKDVGIPEGWYFEYHGSNAELLRNAEADFEISIGNGDGDPDNEYTEEEALKLLEITPEQLKEIIDKCKQLSLDIWNDSGAYYIDYNYEEYIEEPEFAPGYDPDWEYDY